MKEQYLLESRHGTYSVLNQQEDSTWHFVPCPGPFRVVQDMDRIEAVDPSGGPHISKGFDLGDAIVESIHIAETGRIIIELKEK